MDGVESAVDLARCTDRRERLGERGTRCLLFDDQRVIEVEHHGSHHAAILASEAAGGCPEFLVTWVTSYDRGPCNCNCPRYSPRTRRTNGVSSTGHDVLL